MAGDGRWAIDRRHYIGHFGITREVQARLGPSKRSRDDASYTIMASLRAA